MRAMLFDFDTPSTLSLESHMARLSLEANAIGNVIDSFRNLLPSLSDKLRTQFDALVTEDSLKDEVNELKLTFGKLKVKLPHASYVNYSKTLISVPEGFQGNFLEYVTTLSDMSQDVFQEANKTLAEYNFVLSAFITNKENKISLKDHSDLYKAVKVKREKLSDRIAAYFPQDSNTSKAYLGDAIRRFADLDTLVHAVEKLNQQRKNQNIKDISEAVKKCVDLLKIIVEDTQNNGIVKVSGNAALNVSEGAYEIGKYVEFIAVYRFRVEQVVSSVEKLMKTLDTII